MGHAEWPVWAADVARFGPVGELGAGPFSGDGLEGASGGPAVAAVDFGGAAEVEEAPVGGAWSAGRGGLRCGGLGSFSMLGVFDLLPDSVECQGEPCFEGSEAVEVGRQVVHAFESNPGAMHPLAASALPHWVCPRRLPRRRGHPEEVVVNALARAGHSYWRQNARVFQALKVAVERDLPSVLSVVALVWTVAFAASGFTAAALIVAGGSVAAQLLRWAFGR